MNLSVFDSLFPEVCQIIYRKAPELSKALSHFQRVVNYNVPHGKKFRGLETTLAFHDWWNHYLPEVSNGGDTADLDVQKESENANKNKSEIEKESGWRIGDYAENLRIAGLAGWCIEIMQAAFLIHDDIMDQSVTRRGQSCWYRVINQDANLENLAVNDGLQLIFSLFSVLQTLFTDKLGSPAHPVHSSSSSSQSRINKISQSARYVQLLQLFQETVSKTCWGQSLDCLTVLNREAPSHSAASDSDQSKRTKLTSHHNTADADAMARVNDATSQNVRKSTSDNQSHTAAHQLKPPITDFSEFTEERYLSIIEWKTCYYSFCLPVKIGVILCGGELDNQSEALSHIDDILIPMGRLFQMQDDYLDCYGDANVMGKIGTDIQEGKCSWLIVNALKLADQSQLETLRLNYGQSDARAVELVKHVFAELRLDEAFRAFEKQQFEAINALIAEKCAPSEVQPMGMPEALFHRMLRKIYQRQK